MRHKEKDKNLSSVATRLEPELKAALVAEAKATERSVSQLVELYIRHGLGKGKLPRHISLPSNDNNGSPQAA